MYNKMSIIEYYSAKAREIETDVNNLTDSYILSVIPDDYVNYIFQNNALSEIVFDDSGQPTIEKRRGTREVREFGEIYRREHLSIVINLPVIPNRQIGKILDLRPSTFDLSPPKIYYEEGLITSQVDGFLLGDPDAIAREIETTINKIKDEVSRRNSDIRSENEKLKNHTQGIFAYRRSQVQSEDALMESLIQKISIPLKQKRDIATVIPTAVNYSNQARILIPPKTSQPTELVLESDKFNAILNLIDNSCRQFERTPLTFSKLSEQELRDVILSNLNGIFEGDAVGEAFSKKGKTDIYLKVSRGGVFVAECKYWDGAKTAVDAIEQILGYLTWRHSYGVVVIFSRRKNFTDVIDEVVQLIPKSFGYIKGMEKLDLTHFRAWHRLPEDERKLVEIHYVVYNLYAKNTEK